MTAIMSRSPGADTAEISQARSALYGLPAAPLAALREPRGVLAVDCMAAADAPRLLDPARGDEDAPKLTLALADEEQPELLISTATLTGAVGEALGEEIAAFMTASDAGYQKGGNVLGLRAFYAWLAARYGNGGAG